jgi:hypothetical protein
MADLFALVADERRRLADLLDGLSAEQWATPSLCGGWTVRQVLVQLVNGAEATPVGFVGQMVRSGFDFNKSNDRLAQADRRSPEELLVSPRGQLGFGKWGRSKGLAFHATDVGWTHGAGPGVDGPAEALVMALAGRVSGFDGLEGDGVTEFRSRFD